VKNVFDGKGDQVVLKKLVFLCYDDSRNIIYYNKEDEKLYRLKKIMELSTVSIYFSILVLSIIAFRILPLINPIESLIVKLVLFILSFFIFKYLASLGYKITYEDPNKKLQALFIPDDSKLEVYLEEAVKQKKKERKIIILMGLLSLIFIIGFILQGTFQMYFFMIYFTAYIYYVFYYFNPTKQGRLIKALYRKRKY